VELSELYHSSMQKEAASLHREARSTALATATKRKRLQEEQRESPNVTKQDQLFVK
jgi:hypothetical protein